METELSYGGFIERALGGYLGSEGGNDNGCMIAHSKICMQIRLERTRGGGLLLHQDVHLSLST